LIDASSDLSGERIDIPTFVDVSGCPTDSNFFYADA